MAANGLTLKAIVAMCQTNRGIGKAGDLPWRLKKELAHFARMTTFVSQEGKKNAVIMGHNTWKSIPEKRRPLAKRINVVLSRTVKDLGEGVLVCPTFEDALQMLQQSHKDELDTVWVIGGSSVYSTALKHGSCSAIYVTEILKEFECDVFLPEFPSNYKAVDVDDVRSDVQEEDGVQYRYRVYKKVD